MPIAEIITIGTELLLGEIQDTNTRYLARHLRDAGIDLFRTMIVGDNANRIASVIREALTRSDIVITTGGLGPTVDDPTRQAVALAVERELTYNPELWEQILSRFQRFGRQATENNRRQAYIPTGAIPVENQVGTAPAFIIELKEKVIISLPGVPREMEYLLHHAVLPYLKEHYYLHEVIKALVLHTASIGESQIDEMIGDLEEDTNPTLGLLAHPGQVDLRITAKAETEAEADIKINQMAVTIRKRLGNVVYGQDSETLEEKAVQMIRTKGWDFGLLEAGLQGQIYNRIKPEWPQLEHYQTFIDPLPVDQLIQAARIMQEKYGGLIAGANLVPGSEKQTLHLVFISPEHTLNFESSYGGPPDNAPQWAANLCLDQIRQWKYEEG
jgi:nicotinamide-nucleotide amidase